ncbi:MAG: hypothetical protein ACI965_000605 [Paraglaciecola sp.]
MLKLWLEKLAANPNKSWANFKLGLGVFVIGVVLILAGRQSYYWLQIPGLMCITIGLVFAAKGYVGIFVYRMKNAFKQAKAPFDADK